MVALLTFTCAHLRAQVRSSLVIPAAWLVGSEGYEIEGAEGTGVRYHVGEVFKSPLEAARDALGDYIAGIEVLWDSLMHTRLKPNILHPT